MSKQLIVPYKAPAWAQQGLPSEFVPTSRIELAVMPTPIREWKLPDLPEGFEVLIKRDDMTGSSLSGNKVRKLEFLLADAINRGCKHIITCGSFQSNHCRATSIACAQLGLQCHLYLRSAVTDETQIKYEGNLLLDRLVGANLYFVEKENSYMTQLNQTKLQMDELALKIKEETGEEASAIPVGGSTTLGNWGYFNCFEEIRNQGVEFDDIVCCVGSGGTIAGLAIGNYLCGSPYRVHGVLASEKSVVFAEYVDDSLKAYGLFDKVGAFDIISWHQEYMEPGYDENTPEQLEFIAETTQATGILLDNCYTGKAAYGMVQLIKNKPEVFKGRRVLFLHSGGMFSLGCENVRGAILPSSTKGKTTMCDKPVNP